MKKIIKNKMVLAFLLSFCLGVLIVVPNMIIGKGVYSLISDYNVQQVSFGEVMNYSLKEGSFLWSWYNELGSNFIGTYSFYNLFSPFSLIGYLFPASFFPYLNGILMILKYGVSGLTSYLFLKRYVKNKNYAIIGSLLYAFSGAQFTNILFHFSDAMVLFPLLLYTLDNYMYDGKKIWFSLSVMLLAFTNWFFLICQIVFLAIYFLVKWVTKEYKVTWKNFFCVLGEGILGVMLSAVVLIPSCLFIIDNPRVGAEWSILSMFKYDNFGQYVEIVKALLFPPESMALRSFIFESNHSSVDAYLPLVGITLTAACFIKDRKKWYSILLLVCGVMMLVPILNSSFFLFTTSYYARWFYMVTLIMSLMSIRCFDDKEIKIKHGIFLNIILYLIFKIMVLIFIDRSGSSNIIFDCIYFLLMVIVSIGSMILLYFIFKCTDKKRIFFSIIAISIYVIGWGNYITYVYRWKTLDENVAYKQYLDAYKYLDISDSRSNSSPSCMHNLAAIGRFNNVAGFNSNMNGSNFEFYHSIGLERTVSTKIVDDRLNDYLGVKYIVSCYGDEYDEDTYQLEGKYGPYKLYLNDEYREFGFNANKYISSYEFNLLSYDERIDKLGEYVVLSDEQIDKYKDLFTEEVTYNSNDFKFLVNGFSSNIDSTGDTLAIYTVPYDEGWSATNNGSSVEIEKVDNGMMAVKIYEGENEIVFSYMTPGLKSGGVISIFALGILGSYIFVNRRKKVK